MGLFYGQIDSLIQKRLDEMQNGYEPKPDAGVDLLDLFMQSTTDPYELGGMVFSFLSAGRKLWTSELGSSADSLAHKGDTTAFSISWLMKEIHHKDNQHLDAANKIRAEAENLGFTGFNSSYLGYRDAPV